MTRRIFIIGAPLSLNVPIFTSGVRFDVFSYYNFFRSATGGAYYPHEITLLENPNWYDLQAALLWNTADFVTFVFSGHGATGTTAEDTWLDINADKKVKLKDILNHISAKKKLIVIDACRSYVDDSEYFNFMGDVETAQAKPIVFPSYLEFDIARRVFLNALKKTQNGTQILYSCSLGEKSIITKDGSHYSKSMLVSIKAWSLLIKRHSVLLGQGAHNYTSGLIKKYKNKQNPKMAWTSELANFPFALRLGTELL